MSSKPELLVIIGSTRPGRVGLPVGNWIAAAARAHGAFDVRVADLHELALPFMDEPDHPRLEQYEHDHTKAWSATVASADAFVFVLAEYNHGLTAPVKNCIDFLHNEWRHKPAGIVSYGGVSAGLRAAQQLKLTLSALAVPVAQAAVSVPFVQQFVGDDGAVHPNEPMSAGATAMFEELARWVPAMEQLRG